MADIRILIVTDGDRFNFGPQQGNVFNVDYFGISFLIHALESNTTPTFEVHKAHRRGATYAAPHDPDTSVGLTYAGDFRFDDPAVDLGQYDVLWLIGDEGKNAGGTLPTDHEIDPTEKQAIATFMQGGGGVFAVGDHDGIGALMCGRLPRIRTMRKWFEWDEVEHDPATGQIFAPNWSSDGNAMSPGYPGHTDRNDTLHPDSVDTANYYFDDQGDPTPQILKTATGAPLGTAGEVHAILRGAGGVVIDKFPDHMHEGEATDFSTACTSGTFNPNTAGSPTIFPLTGEAEFPSQSGYQPEPEVIAYGTDSGHTTYYGGAPPSPPFYQATLPKSRGVVSVYDGRAVNRGRIVTGSTFHHYLDKNILGDPMTQTTTAGVGPTGSNLGLPAAVKQGIADYFVNTAVWLARPRLDFYFWTAKSSFGFDEAQGGASFPNAFYLAIDGFSPSHIGNPTFVFSGPFKDTGATFTPGSAIFSGAANTAQRILFPFTVSSIPAGAFPAAGQSPSVRVLEARVTIDGTARSAEALFELNAGGNPYFTNTNGTNPFYLSQDLRVFEVTPAAASAPIVPFPSGAGAPFTYVTNLLAHLNDPSNGFTTSSGTDPFQTLNEANDLTEASSVNVMTGGNPTYGFAIARVRILNGSASPVKVFFRLFATQTNDTDYDPQTTYRSTYDAQNLPATPMEGLGHTSFPLYATSGGSGDYAGANVNSRTITGSSGEETWRYFGCYLDVTNVSPLTGTHHCLVAQIAYDGSPIVNSNGITLSPENSDKLAQRNMQVTTSGNPTGPAGHRIPQTFQIRPSARTQEVLSVLPGAPDELMIDWGNTPVGTVASIFWPNANAIDVVRLAMLLYSNDELVCSDENTIQCRVGARATYLPIPFGTDVTLAGLFTLDLPNGVAAGQEFNVVVRRVSTRRRKPVSTNPEAVKKSETGAVKRGLSTESRYVVGTFQVKIPVRVEDEILIPEENKLAIMKWRLERTLPTDRWFRVLQRYVSFLSGRVGAFGGNPSAVLPYPLGFPSLPGGKGGADHLVEHTGKVSEVLFDCFGELEGFVLETCSGFFRFRTRERKIGKLALRACKDRLLLSVFVRVGAAHEIQKLVVHA